MDELQVGLLALGGTAVVAVFAYNKWQEYRHRKLLEQVLNQKHSDVLLDEAVSAAVVVDRPVYAQDSAIEQERFVAEPLLPEPESSENKPIPSERIEPVLRFEEEPELVPELLIQKEDTPEIEAALEVEDPAPAPDPARRAEEVREFKEVPEPVDLLSPLVDFIAAFEAVEPTPANQILESQREVLARIRKPIVWVGYNEFARDWEVVDDEGQSEYRRLRVGLQLVDRQGPLTDGDISIFDMAMQDLGDELMAIVDLPSRQTALENAARLDEFCAGVDIQIGINVISQGQPFPGTKLRALAEAAGMVIDKQGCFIRCDDDGQVLYTVSNQEACGFSVESMKTMTTHGLTFLLDVPRVAHGERVFNQMVDLARRFADVLRGALVDDNRRPLSEGALEPIRRQVGQFQSLMAAQNMPAGDPLTRRLFS